MVVDSDKPQEEGQANVHLKTWVPILIAGFVFFGIFRFKMLCIMQPDQQMMAMPPTCYYVFWVYTLFVGMILLVSNSWWWLARYKSPQFQANNMHDSYSGRRPLQCGDYYMVRLGGICYGITTDFFSTGTAIYPIPAHNQVGSNITANVRIEPRPLPEIPSGLRLFAVRNKLKPPYYYGEIDESKYREVLKAITKEMTPQETKRIMATLGGLSETTAGHVIEMLREECKMCEKHRKDKDMLQQDVGKMFDTVERLRHKGSRIRDIRDKITGRKEEE